jgi:hypothetical protein
MEQHKHRNGSTIDNGGDQRNTNRAGYRIQDPISFDTLQSKGRVLTRAIRRAERKGDMKQAESLFMEKAELVRRLGEILRAN